MNEDEDNNDIEDQGQELFWDMHCNVFVAHEHEEKISLKLHYYFPNSDVPISGH